MAMQNSGIEAENKIIDLGLGHPSPGLLPLERFRTAFLKASPDSNPELLQYGPDEGGASFRQTLAGWLTCQYGQRVQPESLFISCGISQALDLVCTIFTQPGDVVFVEEPTYFYVYDIFRNHHLQIVGIPLDAEGLQIDVLAKLLKKYRPAFLYTIPAFHNPSSVTLTSERRKQLAAMSYQYDFIIVSDEAYQFLNYNITPPPAFALEEPGQKIISLGSFSKILGPGLRLGWIQTTADLRQKLIRAGYVISGGGLNPITGEIARSFIELGFQDEQLASLKNVYSARCQALCNALTTLLPGKINFKKPDGGFFLWMRLPEGVDAGELLDKARARGVAFKPGFLFSNDRQLRNYIRLSFSYYSSELIGQGIERLVAAFS